MALAARHQQPVFDHVGGGADQPQRVRIAPAVFAGDVQNAQYLPGGRQDGCGGAGQKAVALQKMFCAVHFHGRHFGQRGADGVGAALLFVPRGAAGQGHPFGLAQKVGVTTGVHQRAAGAGQHHHALAVAYLLKQVLHHGARMRQQLLVVAAQLPQGLVFQVVGVAQSPGGQQAAVQAALPRPCQALVHEAEGALARFQQVLAGLPQCHRCGSGSHGVCLLPGRHERALFESQYGGGQRPGQ